MSGFYHLGFVVADIERAMSDMTHALGVRWRAAPDGQLGQWEYRIAFSTEGPPFFEVIQGPVGSPWDATAGSRLDHIGYWSEDLSTDQEWLAQAGAPVDFDACPFGRSFTYHRLASLGVRVELVDTALQSGFLETWSPGAPPMAPLRPHDPSAQR